MTDLTSDTNVFDQTGRLAAVAPAPNLDTPEPVTLALVGLGLAGLGFSRRRR